MARLPSPGGDNDQWGDILNDFLAQEHNADGSQKPLPQSKVTNLTSDLAAKADSTALTSKLDTTDPKVTADQAPGTASIRTLGYGTNQAAQGSAVDARLGVVENSRVLVDTAVNWTNTSPILANGQIGVETDTGKIKVGDGMTTWTALGYNVATRRTRRALAVVGTSYAAQFTIADLAVRRPVGVPVTTTRWRLRVRNYNVQVGIPTMAGANFTATYIGEQVVDANGEETPNFNATPLQALPGFTLAADGSEYVSGWVTSSTLQFIANRNYLLSMGWTGAGVMNWGTTRSWHKSNASGEVDLQTVTGYTANHLSPLDIRIEYDSEITSGLVIAILGDSTTHGCGNNLAYPIAHQKRWPEQWATRLGHMTANGACASSQVGDQWSSSANWIFQRFLPDTISYDAVISDLGINDIAGATAFATFKTKYVSHIAAIRAVFGNDIRIIANGLKPNGANTHGLLTQRAPAATTVLQTSVSFSNGVALRIGQGYAAESVTTSGVSTGTGPFATTITAGLINAHDVGEVLAGQNERNRIDINNWLATLPCGIDGFNPTHHAVQASYDSALYQGSFGADVIHPSQAGHGAIQAVVPDIEKTIG